MKKFSSAFITILAVALLAALLFSVSAGAEETSAPGDRLTVRNSWEIDAAYPAMPNEATGETVRQWLEKLLDDLMEEQKGALVSQSFPEYSWTATIDYEMIKPSDNAISIVFTSVGYSKGAAHPMTTMAALNLDAATGAILTPGDLFADPDAALDIFAARAQGYALEYLKKYAGDPDDYTLDGDFWFVEGFERDWDNYACLALEPGGVRVIFQRYQVAPYALGNPEAFFPLSVLEPAGPSEKVWPGR